MGLGNGNPKEGDKGSNFFWELKVLQGLEAIAEAIEAGEVAVEGEEVLLLLLEMLLQDLVQVLLLPPLVH